MTEQPSDITAERFLLACLMNGPGYLVEEVAQVVEPADFYRAGHQEIFSSAVSLYSSREPVDPVTIWDWLSQNEATRSIGGDRMYLHNLYDLTVVASDAPSYARIVRRTSVLRKADEAGQSLSAQARTQGSDPADVLERWEKTLRDLSREVGDDLRAPGPAYLMADQSREMKRLPVIPGLLGHEDRVVAVGLEGDGKTTLAYQMAHCLSAGLHPFTFTEIEPKRSLLVDLENPGDHLSGQLAWLGDITTSAAPGWDRDRLWVWSHPGGVNLKDPRDAMMLADVIRRAKPDFIYAGPIYKMVQDDGEESAHAYVTRFWDRMRSLHHFALWMEAHVPLHTHRGDRVMRPLGSGIYVRWPEFGFSLTRSKKQAGVLTLDRFRGDRIKNRTWPESFSRASFGQWPWSATYPEGTLDLGHHEGQDQ
jgi:replicative DNA helicase